MAKPEWGQKRHCQACGARFYDLGRAPIVCPKCEAEFDPLAHLRPRRSRAAAARPAVAEKVGAPAEAVTAAVLPVDDEDELEAVGDDEDEPIVADADADLDDDESEDEDELIEDASELGEDDDDMSEVLEGVDGEEEDA